VRADSRRVYTLQLERTPAQQGLEADTATPL